MATFQERIEDIIGATASVGSDNASANEQAIQDALQDTASDILNKVRPDILLPLAVASSSETGNPIATGIETIRILNVERNSENDLIGDFISCVFIDSSLTNKVQVPESIYYATEDSPRWTFHNKNIYVYPAPNSNNAARYLYVANPTIEHGDSSVAAFPNELEQTLVLGASARLKQRQITFFNEDEDSEVVAMHRAQYQELLSEYANALAPFMVSGR
tara:strand:- start:825 stop:1478 length:654 start_codon:yes stop_codon:yes gene_type:complete